MMAAGKYPAVRSEVIIVVENDGAVRRSLKFSLEAEGFVVRTYAAGEDLLRDAPVPNCDCLVVAEFLPGIRGIDLVARLRESKVSAPAILITSHPSPILRRRAEDAGIPIIEKPLLGSALLDGIRRVTRVPSMH